MADLAILMQSASKTEMGSEIPMSYPSRDGKRIQYGCVKNIQSLPKTRRTMLTQLPKSAAALDFLTRWPSHLFTPSYEREFQEDMQVVAYIALIRPGQEGGFRVDFPDFPECATAGETLRHARLLAEATLSAHLEGLQQTGVRIPEPSCLKELLQRDPETAQAISMLVAV